MGNGQQDAGESVTSKVSRRTIVAGAAWATPVVMLASASPALAVSPPGGSGVACSTNDGYYHTKGGGKFFNGSLFGLNLDNLVAVRGIDVENLPLGGNPGVTYKPANAVVNPVVIAGRPADDDTVDAYSNPLQIDVLNTVAVDLGSVGATVGELLNFASTGVYNQFGHARENGASIGFSGLVADSGGVTLSAVAGAPSFGNVNLKTILSQLLGTGALTTIINNLASLNLNIGAVGAIAESNPCLQTSLRDYLIASMDLTVGSNALVTALNPVVGSGGAIDAIESAVDALVAPGGLLSGLVDGIANLIPEAINDIPGANLLVHLKQGSANGTATVDLDLSSVRTLLQKPLKTDALELSLVDPAKMLYVNLDALVGSLNNKAPGTRVLPANANVTEPLIDDIATFLNQLPTTVTTALWTALNGAKVKLNVDLTLQYKEVKLVPPSTTWVDAATVGVALDTTLGALIAGDAHVDVTLVGQGALGETLVGLLGTPFETTLETRVDTLLDTTGTAINNVIKPLVDNVGTLLGAPVKAVLTNIVDPLLLGLLGGGSVPGLIELTVNIHDDPFTVTALELGILPNGGGIDIALARAYAGENIAVPA